ncbi:hypothetical protein GGR56DRAFT_623357 [Xylariaceae sp. FL0804]|nr:hypothetical protein GGR56DRAFT_623357 [Xylariaceae sp. FL0804]
MRHTMAFVAGESSGVDGAEEEVLAAVVPCRSLWDARGGRLGLVVVYETRLVRADG